MKTLIVDTNIFINYSRGKNDDLLKIIDYARKEDWQLAVSPAIIFEYWVGEELNRKTKKEEAEKLLKDFAVIEINDKIAKKAAEIFRKEKIRIPVNDLIIAASAILTNSELVTDNLKHFQKIKDLKFFDLKKLRK